MTGSTLAAVAAALFGATVPAPDVLEADLSALRAAAAEAEAPQPEAPGTPAVEVGRSQVPDRTKPRSWFALPMLFWLPETKLGFAATGGVHFHLREAAEASNAFLVAGYTSQGQGSVDLSSDLWLRGGTLLSGRFRAVHYPDSLYGIGPETTLAEREEMTRRFAELNLGADLPVLGRRLRAGPRVHLRAEEIRDVTPGGLVAADAVPGSNGFGAVGFGGALAWDSRDRKLWPTHGAFSQASYLYYPAAVGRNGGFGRASAEGRLFRPLGRGRVLGLAALFEQVHGETPFSLLSKLGSTRYLRGIREGRYRDQIAWAAQAEVRLPLREGLAAALFGAFGDVAKDLGSLSARTLKIGGGAGLRFRLTNEGANLRIDVAAADAGPEVYVLLLEAF
jgi:hypothetical protein